MIGLVACSEPPDVVSLSDDRYEILDGGDCVRDTITDLTWERKIDEAGLRNWRNTYTWYDPDEDQDEIDYRGIENGGSCAGSACDTWHYPAAVNTSNLCGYSDWRLPTRDELMSISDLRKAKLPPTVNLFAFPHTKNTEYWSGNDYSFRPDTAWAWNFQYGHDRVDWKKTPKAVRLVRGSALALVPVTE